jgi:peptidoglycan hydrolase-like protein with peptidoglycan-binding domain
MNRSIALVSAALLLGAAPVAALAQSNTQQRPAAGTYQAPSASGTQQQMSGQNQNMNGSASGANTNAAMSGPSGSSMADTKSPEEVQKVQTALNQKGERVKVDGIWGPQTEQALRDFQRRNGLQASGQLDDQTLRKLNVASQ